MKIINEVYLTLFMKYLVFIFLISTEMKEKKSGNAEVPMKIGDIKEDKSIVKTRPITYTM